MKPSRLILALALCLLLTSSCAIRIQQDSNPVESQVNNDEKIAANINGGVKACKDNEDCSSTSTTTSSSGKVRKLMISMNSSPSTPPTTTTTSTKSSGIAASNRKTEKPNPSFESETTAANSQDLGYGDINEMDYSPAKRKPPIHN